MQGRTYNHAGPTPGVKESNMSNLTPMSRQPTFTCAAAMIAAGPPAPHVRLSNAELLAVAMADATAPAPATDFGGVA